jgi:drug/metabolite transporter (DMT)-like permease
MRAGGLPYGAKRPWQFCGSLVLSGAAGGPNVSQIQDFAKRRPEAFGVLITLLGVGFFIPDALVVRLIGADTMTIAVWRGLAAGGATLGWLVLFQRQLLPSWRELLSPAPLAMIFLQGVGSVLFLASMGATSVANALLILATAPFLAALLSWAVLGERIGRDTALAIVGVFAGVGIIAAGSGGGGRLFGDLMAVANAVTIACYYVVLRQAKSQNLLAAIALGYLLTSAIALPFAPMAALDARQIMLIILSGAGILAGGAALLMIGPRYLPAAEVSMITMLEVVLGPLLVWAVIGETPATLTLIGGAVILIAILIHTAQRLRAPETA